MLTPTMPGRRAPREQALLQRLVAFIVEAETIDDGAMDRQAEDARARIAGLRQRRHRADFGKAHAEREHGVRHLAVLVETGRDADRVLEVKTEKIDAEGDGIGPVPARPEAHAERADRQTVRGFGIDDAGEGTDEREKIHAVQLSTPPVT